MVSEAALPDRIPAPRLKVGQGTVPGGESGQTGKAGHPHVPPWRADSGVSWPGGLGASVSAAADA